jgi:hypothetical protein
VTSRQSISPSTGREHWPEALATVLECKYDFGAGRALAFGLPTQKHFRIRYNYFADGDLHEGEFASAKALPQGHLFPIRYDPDAPHEHTHAAQSPLAGSRGPLIAFGIAGSVILSLLWLAILRGCS